MLKSNPLPPRDCWKKSSPRASKICPRPRATLYGLGQILEALGQDFFQNPSGRGWILQPLKDGHISEGILPGPDWADIKDHGIFSSFSAIPTDINDHGIVFEFSRNSDNCSAAPIVPTKCERRMNLRPVWTRQNSRKYVQFFLHQRYPQGPNQKILFFKIVGVLSPSKTYCSDFPS